MLEPLPDLLVEPVVRAALAEDLGRAGDITSAACIAPDARLAASFVVRTILVVVVAALLAYALAPAVSLLTRIMPRVLAILIVYLVVLTGISFLLYFIINTTIAQVTALINNLQVFLAPNSPQLNQIVAFLNRYGISQQQITGFYNAQCCGLAFQYQTYNFGALSPLPPDHRFFLSFTLAGLGNFSPFNGAMSGVPR